MVRGLLIILLYAGILIGILFTSAGRWNWGMGWAALGIRIVTSFTALFFADPELLKERSRIRAGTKRWDMVLASISALFVYPFTLALAGLDVGRFRWSPTLHLAVQAVALAVFALGNGLTLWAAMSGRIYQKLAKHLQNWATGLFAYQEPLRQALTPLIERYGQPAIAALCRIWQCEADAKRCRLALPEKQERQQIWQQALREAATGLCHGNLRYCRIILNLGLDKACPKTGTKDTDENRLSDWNTWLGIGQCPRLVFFHCPK